jgi:hypothetical protein
MTSTGTHTLKPSVEPTGDRAGVVAIDEGAGGSDLGDGRPKVTPGLASISPAVLDPALQDPEAPKITLALPSGKALPMPGD